MPRPLARPAHGASLVELLVGMVIALMVLAVALQLTLIARARYQRLADEALVEERGTQALELIGSAVRQAGWITDTPSSSSMRRWPDADAPPSLFGKDDCGGPAMLPALRCQSHASRCSAPGCSDALLIRFAGRSTDPQGSTSDGATRDCTGHGVPERIAGETDPRAGYILLYVSRSSDTTREPQLMCRSIKRDFERPPDETTGDGFVRGVETLQLLYTLAPTATAPAVTMSAGAMNDQDWHRVQLIHVALVVRGDRFAAGAPRSDDIALFPDLASPEGVQSDDLRYRPAEPHRYRARFTATLAVRNPLRCEADAC